MTVLNDAQTSINALYNTPGLSSLGQLKPGLAEALLFLIASGGQIQTSVSPGFTGFGRFPRTENDCQYRLPVNSRLVSFICCQASGTDLFVQMHSKVTDLVAGDPPVEAFSIDVGSPGVAAVTLADHGSSGRGFGANPVIAISTTRDIFTPVTPAVLVINSRATVTLTGQVVV